MTLVFTAVKKATPPAPDTMYRHPGVDYLEFAQRMRTEIDTQRQLIAKEQRSVKRLRGRVHNGRRWIAAHDNTHPRYEHNRELLGRLEWSLDCEQWAVRDAHTRLLDLLTAFWGAYDTLSPMERALVDTDGIERPDPERYWQAMNHWERKEI